MPHSSADIFNFLSKLTFRKSLNAAQIFSSYYLSKVSKQPIQWGLPFNISIEPTTSCNLRCPECPSGLRSFTRPTGMLEKKFFQKTIDELHSDLIYLYFYFQGEPYLNPDFLDMVKYASQKNIYTVTSTNAHYLDEENAKKTVESGLDRIIISIDGTTQETYESYRVGGQLQKVLDGTKNLVQWRKKLNSKTPHIIFQFLVVKPNEHQIDEVNRIAKETGVDEVKLKTAQVYDYEAGSELIPSIEKYSRYEKTSDGKYKIKNNLDNHCWKLWHSSVITWDGKVVPCCFDKDAAHQMGNLQQTTFREIWNNPAYQNFRSKILQSRKEIDICRNCTEGLKVWA
jgi:radical SAM protein with 4Fe4S-binding SPASM domain